MLKYDPLLALELINGWVYEIQYIVVLSLTLHALFARIFLIPTFSSSQSITRFIGDEELFSMTVNDFDREVFVYVMRHEFEWTGRQVMK